MFRDFHHRRSYVYIRHGKFQIEGNVASNFKDKKGVYLVWMTSPLYFLEIAMKKGEVGMIGATQIVETGSLHGKRGTV
jgi:hypothetical protein